MSPPPPPPSEPPPPEALKAQPVSIVIPSKKRRTSSAGQLTVQGMDYSKRRRSSTASLIEELNAIFGKNISISSPTSPISFEAEKLPEKDKKVLTQLNEGDASREDSGKDLKEDTVVAIPFPSTTNPPPPPPPESLKEKKVVIIIDKKMSKKPHEDTPRPSLERPSLDEALLQELQARMNDSSRSDSSKSIEQTIEENRLRRASEENATRRFSSPFVQLKKVNHKDKSESEIVQQQQQVVYHKQRSRSLTPKTLAEAIAKRFGCVKEEEETEAKEDIETKTAENEQKSFDTTTVSLKTASTLRQERENCGTDVKKSSIMMIGETSTIDHGVKLKKRLSINPEVEIYENVNDEPATLKPSEKELAKAHLLSNNEIGYDDLAIDELLNQFELKDVPGSLVLQFAKLATQHTAENNKSPSNITALPITNAFSRNESKDRSHNLYTDIRKASIEKGELGENPIIIITEENQAECIGANPLTEADQLKSENSKQERVLKWSSLPNTEEATAVEVVKTESPLLLDSNRQNFLENKESLSEEPHFGTTENNGITITALKFAELEAIVIESQEILSQSQKYFSCKEELQRWTRLRQLDEECRAIESGGEKKDLIAFESNTECINQKLQSNAQAEQLKDICSSSSSPKGEPQSRANQSGFGDDNISGRLIKKTTVERNCALLSAAPSEDVVRDEKAQVEDMVVISVPAFCEPNSRHQKAKLDEDFTKLVRQIEILAKSHSDVESDMEKCEELVDKKHLKEEEVECCQDGTLPKTENGNKIAKERDIKVKRLEYGQTQPKPNRLQSKLVDDSQLHNLSDLQIRTEYRNDEASRKAASATIIKQQVEPSTQGLERATQLASNFATTQRQPTEKRLATMQDIGTDKSARHSGHRRLDAADSHRSTHLSRADAAKSKETAQFVEFAELQPTHSRKSESVPADKSRRLSGDNHGHQAATFGLRGKERDYIYCSPYSAAHRPYDHQTSGQRSSSTYEPHAKQSAVDDDKQSNSRTSAKERSTNQRRAVEQLGQFSDLDSGDQQKAKAIGVKNRRNAVEQSDSAERPSEKPPRRPWADQRHTNSAAQGDPTDCYAGRLYGDSHALYGENVKEVDEPVKEEQKKSGSCSGESDYWIKSELRRLDSITQPIKCFPPSTQHKKISRVEMNHNSNGQESPFERSHLWSPSITASKHIAPRDVKQRDRERKSQSRSHSAVALEETMKMWQIQARGSRSEGDVLAHIIEQPGRASPSTGHSEYHRESDETDSRRARMDGEASTRRRRSSAHGGVFHSQVRAKRSESEHRTADLLQSKYRDLPRLTSQLKYESVEPHSHSRTPSVQYPYDGRQLSRSGTSTSIENYEYRPITSPPRLTSPQWSSTDRSSPYWYPSAMQYEVPKFVQKEIQHSREASLDRSGLSILQYRNALEKKL